MAAQAGVAEDDLRFSYSRPCFHAMEEDLEMEDLTYEMMVKWVAKYPDLFEFQAIGLDKLEELVASGQF